jgi:tRNA(Ile)-lysidine synthase
VFESIFKQIKTHTCVFDIDQPKILLGLSGGPDSVFLFYFLKSLHEKKKINLVCAHLNHGWRTTAGQDKRFCTELCKTHDIPIFIEHAEEQNLELKENGSKEELGRKLRRHFFETLCKKENIDFIALAHHQQDQQETFFIRLLRGTTLDGLTSMKPIDGIYFRPLLNMSKENILKYLADNNLEYCIDETNESDQYLRNRIRKYIIPAFIKCDKRFDQKFASTLRHLKEENDFLQAMTIDIYNNLFVPDKHVSLSTFKNLPLVIQKRLIPHWLTSEQVAFSPSDRYIEEVIRFLLASQGGSHQLHSSWSIKKKQNQFWIEKT